MSKQIVIGNNVISTLSKPFLIAEIGLNHNKDIELAKKMILSAKKSFADAVKFQTYKTERLVVSDSPAFKLFKDLELTESEFKELSDYCKKINIIFFSTPFCFESVDLLERLDVPCYKIASMDTNYYELLSYVGRTKKPVILSTGMTDIKIIENAVNTVNKSGNDNIILLHTISKYPPEYEDMDMKMIERLKTLFNYPVGFSDHTRDNTMALVARTLGADVFEKHFTLDKKLPGPDHGISSTPDDFIDLNYKLNIIDKSLQSHPSRTDKDIEIGARRSLYASRNLKINDIITRDMIDVIRPFNKGMNPEEINQLIGKPLKRDMNKGEMFNLSCI